MEFLSQLWQPIVVSAVLVFLVSSVIHMALPIHKSDKKALPNEARAMEALRGTPPGQYFVPFCGGMKEMGTPEMAARFEKGPIAHLTVLPNGMPKIGPALIQWFLFTLIVGVMTAYVSWHSVGMTNDYLRVFQITGAVAFIAYGVGQLDNSIWRGTPWGITFKFVIDGLAYALVTAGSFGWLWPRG